MAVPNCPKTGPKSGPEKRAQTVPTGRVIKYPKKCALFCPARAGPGGGRATPPGHPPGGVKKAPSQTPHFGGSIVAIYVCSIPGRPKNGSQEGVPGGCPGGSPGGISGGKFPRPRGRPGAREFPAREISRARPGRPGRPGRGVARGWSQTGFQDLPQDRVSRGVSRGGSQDHLQDCLSVTT